MNILTEPRTARRPASYTRLQDALLVGYIIFLPVQFHMGDPGRLAISDIFLILTILGTLCGAMTVRIIRSGWSLWHPALLGVFAISSFVTLQTLGEVPRYVMVNKDIGLLVLYVGYAVVMSAAYSWERIRWILRTLILAVSLQNALWIAAFLASRTVGFKMPFFKLDDTRLTGLLVDPNAYGGLLVMTLGVHLFAGSARRPLFKRPYDLFATITLATGVVLTYSRSAWIGLTALILMVILFRPKAGVKLAALSGLAFYGILHIMGQQYFEEMRQMALRPSQVQDRVEIINAALPMFREHPVFGIGLGVYVDRIGVIIHNTPVWILTECGSLGFIVFCGFCGWFLLRGIRAYAKARGDERAILLGLMSGALAMMGLSMGIEALYQRHLWLMWALIVAAATIVKKEQRVRQAQPADTGARREETCA